MIQCCRIRPNFIPLVVGAFIVSGVVFAESVTMPYADYMAHCMNTYGDDNVTESVCESQYRAIEKKEQALTAQAEPLSSMDEESEE